MHPVSRLPGASVRHSADLEEMKSEGKLFSDGADVIAVTGRASMNPGRLPWKGTNTMRVAFLLTILQFSFAMYATFLLYWLSPAVPDLHVDPESANWANQISRIGKIFPTSYSSQVPNRLIMEMETTPLALQASQPKSAVCEFEEIAFEQKISNNTKMIEIKTSLFRSVACTLPFPPLLFHSSTIQSVSESMHIRGSRMNLFEDGSCLGNDNIHVKSQLFGIFF